MLEMFEMWYYNTLLAAQIIILVKTKITDRWPNPQRVGKGHCSSYSSTSKVAFFLPAYIKKLHQKADTWHYKKSLKQKFNRQIRLTVFHRQTGRIRHKTPNLSGKAGHQLQVVRRGNREETDRSGRQPGNNRAKVIWIIYRSLLYIYCEAEAGVRAGSWWQMMIRWSIKERNLLRLPTGQVRHDWGPVLNVRISQR